MKAWICGTVVLAVLLVGSGLAAASASTPSPDPAATPAWPYTLYGNALTGWGPTATTITKPGPTLVVTTGESLDLHLFSADGQTHNWTVDVNNDSQVQASEPQSGYFNATTGPIWFNFTVTLAPGVYTYRCGFHPSNMWGELVVQAAPTFTLWGSAGTVHGWGFTSTSITFPGPRLNVNQGQTVTLDLFSADGLDHTFYVDFAKTGSATGNTASPVFNGSHPIRWTFVASTAGNFTYACGLHGQSLMSGPITIASSASTPPPPTSPDYTVYAAVIVIVVIVAIVAVIAIRRKPRTPPEQPPATPPQQG